MHRLSMHFYLHLSQKNIELILEKTMKKYTENYQPRNEQQLQNLLNQRKAPLSQDGLNNVLKDLTLYMTKDIFYFGVLYPKKGKLQEDDISCTEVEKADMMEGTDGERYYPVFTSIEKLNNWKAKMQKGEAIYVFDKNDLLTFLNLNQKLAAIVVNPQEDDLLLHRMLLQNMIQVASETN